MTARSRSRPRPPPPSPAASAELARLRELAGRVCAGRALTPGQRRDLGMLLARHAGVKPRVVPPGAPVVVSAAAQVAEAYGVDERTVGRWQQLPDWPAGLRGPYALKTVGPWVRAYWRAEAASPNAGAAERKLEAQADRLRAMADLARMEADQRRGALVAVETVLERNGRLLGLIAGLHENLAREVPGVADLLAREWPHIEARWRAAYAAPKAQKKEPTAHDNVPDACLGSRD